METTTRVSVNHISIYIVLATLNENFTLRSQKHLYCQDTLNESFMLRIALISLTMKENELTHSLHLETLNESFILRITPISLCNNPLIK